jgi:hypothetical protein
MDSNAVRYLIKKLLKYDIPFEQIDKSIPRKSDVFSINLYNNPSTKNITTSQREIINQNVSSLISTSLHKALA